jgi:hypothetical protein
MSDRTNTPKRRIPMLWTLAVILVFVWLIDILGGNISANLPQLAEANIAQTADVTAAVFQYNNKK